jgi:hypothetical protein
VGSLNFIRFFFALTAVIRKSDSSFLDPYRDHVAFFDDSFSVLEVIFEAF